MGSSIWHGECFSVGLNLHFLPGLNHVERLASEMHNLVLVLGFFPLFSNFLRMSEHTLLIQ